MTIEEFLESPVQNQWVEWRHFSIYVRKGVHMIDRERRLVLDIANIENRVSRRGRGEFRELIAFLLVLLQTHSRLTHIRVENVHNPRLRASLPSMGFQGNGVDFWLPVQSERCEMGADHQPVDSQ